MKSDDPTLFEELDSAGNDNEGAASGSSPRSGATTQKTDPTTADSMAEHAMNAPVERRPRLDDVGAASDRSAGPRPSTAARVMTSTTDRPGKIISDVKIRTERTIASSLWAAWADALGFISELTSEAGLRRRLGGKPLRAPVTWTRRVGGRGGPDKVLPAGTYSDDTQLRLAVARCLSPRGFDTNAFAHVELPSWLVYALGGGHATRSAANTFMRPNTAWYATHPDGWINSGGNGAAMRIQPHVWASPDPSSTGSWLSGLMSDACTTHAHPRALLGAALHAYALGAAITTGKVLEPAHWDDLLDAVSHDALNTLQEHPELSEYWLPAYDAAARQASSPSFAFAWTETVAELREQLTHARTAAKAIRRHALSQGAADGLGRITHAAYRQLIDELSLANPSRRGSGTATVVAALCLADAYADRPDLAALLAASTTDTDTDTIATMAAAIAGASAGTLPPNLNVEDDYSDRSYLVSEANRLVSLAAGQKSDPPIRYPDLLTWELPKAQVDLVGSVDGGQVAIAGLSVLKPAEEAATVQGEFQWQWFLTAWDQHMLIRSRVKLRPLPVPLLPVADNPAAPHARSATPRSQTHATTKSSNERQRRVDRQALLTGEAAIARHEALANDTDTTRSGVSRPREFSGPLLEEDLLGMVRWVAGRGFADADIGIAIRRVAATATAAQFHDFSVLLYDALSRQTHNPR